MRKILILLFLLISVNVLSQGDEMITNGTFSNGDGWSFSGPGWSISDGVANYSDADAPTDGSILQSAANMAIVVEASHTYTITLDLNVLNGLCNMSFYSTNLVAYKSATYYTTGSLLIEFTTPSSIGDGGLLIYGWSLGDYTIDNLSMVESAEIGASPYYIATDGNDAASGSILNPWKTWQKGFNEANPGDTVYFRGGIYYEDGGAILDPTLGIGNTGEVDNWIYFMAYPNEQPILDLSKYVAPSSGNTGISISWVTYIYFKGLTVRNIWQRVAGVTAKGIECYGTSNLIFENITVHNVGGRGFGFFGGFGNHALDERIPDVPADTTRYINCDAYNLYDSLCVSTDPEFCSNFHPGGIADGFKFNNTIGSYVSFEYCRAWNYSDNGFDPNGLCLIYMNGNWAFNGGWVDYDGNITEGSGFKYGNQVDIDTDDLLRVLTNNVSVYNKSFGYDENNSRSDPWYYTINERIDNNISYKNESFIASVSRLHEGEVSRELFRNNITYQDTDPPLPYYLTLMLDEYNSWNTPPGVTITDEDFISVDSTGITAARQADGSLPDNECYNEFLHLAEGSDLIGAGIGVGLLYDAKGNLRNQDTISLGPFDPLSSEVSDPDDPVYPSMVTSTPTYNAASATLLGEIENNGGAEITASGFVWGTSVNPTLSSGNIAPNTTRTETTFSNSISPLQKGTTYHVRAYATNSAGTAYGSDVSFTTPALGMIQSGGKTLFYNGKQIKY